MLRHTLRWSTAIQIHSGDDASCKCSKQDLFLSLGFRVKTIGVICLCHLSYAVICAVADVKPYTNARPPTLLYVQHYIVRRLNGRETPCPPLTYVCRALCLVRLNGARCQVPYSDLAYSLSQPYGSQRMVWLAL